MEINDESLAYVRQALLDALSPQATLRRDAEKKLTELEPQGGFTIILLHLMNNLAQSTQRDDTGVRQSASVYFKNSIKKRWEPIDDDCQPIPELDRENIKAYVIDLMCTAPKDVQFQLSEAISIISKHDFPSKWLTLLPMLVEKLNTSDLNILYGVMLTANSLMKRFRNTHQSDELFEELLYCLKSFQEPLTQLLLSMNNLFLRSQQNPQEIQILLEILRLTIRIFYSLNWQDIPEYFEDHLGVWMPEFAKYLTYENEMLTHFLNNTHNTGGDTEPGPIEKLKTGIIENLILYATKYEEMFMPYLGQFTEMIWQLLVSVSRCETKYDQLTTVAIKYLTTISSKQINASLFTDQILQQIIEQIIVPNLMSTSNDEELFHENPSDYIRKDMEGSDQDTRRRSACDFIRSLLKNFRTKTSELCVSYIDGMLQQYTSSGKKDWRLKDGALHLVLAASILSTTLSHGAGTLNPEINILTIFQIHVLPEIHELVINENPIVKADAIKLICTLRSYFPTSFLLELLPHLTRYLKSEYIVIQTYAALCIEKFLTIKEENHQLRLHKEMILPILVPLFSSLFPVLENEELPENDYVMKCIMRLLTVVGVDIKSVTQLVLHHLTISLERVCKNPANPFFNHYLFECIALLVRSCCSPTAVSSLSQDQQMEIFTQFESLLFPLFQTILQMDVIEFVPYVFQILAQLLSYRPVGTGLSDAYRELFPPLLSPSLWLRKGNIPALTDLLLAYIYQGINEIIATNLLEGVLGIFQKLLASKVSRPLHSLPLISISLSVLTLSLSISISVCLSVKRVLRFQNHLCHHPDHPNRHSLNIHADDPPAYVDETPREPHPTTYQTFPSLPLCRLLFLSWGHLHLHSLRKYSTWHVLHDHHRHLVPSSRLSQSN
jgi:exportin-2 (importin alpha re-exporter)